MEDIFKDKRPLKDIIIHELWLNTRIPKVIIEEIIMSEFKFIKYNVMPEYKTIWLQGFGTFGIKPTRLKRFADHPPKNVKYRCECGWVGNNLQHDDEGRTQCPICKTKISE
jgi:hypothetical protein